MICDLRALMMAGAASLALGAHAQISFPLTETFPTGAPDHAWEDHLDVPYTATEATPTTAPDGDGFGLTVSPASGQTGWHAAYLADDIGISSDYKITAYAYVGSSDGSNWSRVALVARAQVSSTVKNQPMGYYLQMDSDGSQYLRVVTVGNGLGVWTETLYADTATPNQYIVPGWNKLELETTMSNIKATVNDNVVFDGTSTIYGSGRIAILNYKATATAPVSTIVDRIEVVSTAAAAATDWNLY